MPVWAYLAAARDLTLLSVWSPTFALELLSSLSKARLEIAEVLSSGHWEISRLAAPLAPAQADVLRRWDGKVTWAFTRELWPELALVSSWDSSTSAPWALELRALFPHAAFQGKGLWATEGVVSIPFENAYPAAITSHFLEFRDLERAGPRERILPVWRLKPGMQLQPLLTTGNGFFRYALPDRVEVTGHLRGTPCLRFRGRLHGVDLVGEKIDALAASELLRDLSVPGERECVSLLAMRKPGSRPGYTLLAKKMGQGASAKGGGAGAGVEQLAAEVEARLMTFHHYRLARELGQLEPARAVVREDALGVYESLLSGTRIPGSLKIEPVTLVDRAIFEGNLNG